MLTTNHWKRETLPPPPPPPHLMLLTHGHSQPRHGWAEAWNLSCRALATTRLNRWHLSIIYHRDT